ncbi:MULTISPECIES: phosphatidylcholine/phosphatidylserine synthase [unclassified Novosphingobium]|uniref:CDP-alcohol phosphatidyltransferase family protein n=1 Tax=unclassified Novosphingobium TaxID=2644732 RepID=UPI0025DBDD40|nr:MULTISPECIES: phosphatidylcholine/phosphatidylserine synthase [unclassified Novosphingobium]HQV02905.1 phosphatidylcholine/phosphatidylserine synthase [Novosphingobium sp.]
MVPNAITAAALCAGLTGIRFGITGDFDRAVLAVVIAGMLDGIDGRIARLLKAQSRFGAELDSLADNVSFGVAPALILFLWSLNDLPRLGWFAALAYAVACALRLARFNARIDLADEPRKTAGFLTGVPAPVGAGLVFLPLYLWTVTDNEQFRDPRLVGVWLVAMAFLMISSVATLSWGKLRLRKNFRLEALLFFGLVGAAMLTEPWWTLIGICAVYLTLLPIGMISYARIKRQRARSADAAG